MLINTRQQYLIKLVGYFTLLLYAVTSKLDQPGALVCRGKIAQTTPYLRWQTGSEQIFWRSFTVAALVLALFHCIGRFLHESISNQTLGQSVGISAAAMGLVTAV
jgi:hypothetical protein